ncbi:hypothetical protein [Sphingomonas montana]|uniref:hypothetical protein n=1 Tax=Sphingomonas montana TaxID=1843236 RepID=UPI00096C291D|nr:hypothetical protein [Sphingomonas montana]
MMARLVAVACAVAGAHLVAAPLAITRSVRVISDTLNGPAPRIVPGTIVDYEIVVANQLDVFLRPAQDEKISETIPDTIRVRLTPLGANGSPVQFEDGGLLGLGILPSGATFSFVSLASQTDGLDFSNGAWGYVPQPDANGYDPALRGIRVTLGGTHQAGRSFRLRYRALIP